MNIQKISGLIAAPFTPMKPDGEINPDLVPAYAEKLKEDGVKGVFICGTTGEGMLLTNEERKNITESWIKEQTEDFKIIVHVGTTSAKQSKDLAKHARQTGAFATGCMGPVFLNPAHLEELTEFCAEVSSGAPELPFYYYHIPSVSANRFSMVSFLKLGQKAIPNLAGIKFTDNNFMDMKQCMESDGGKWDILHGYDEMLLAGLAFGAKGAVGSTYNFMAPLYYGIIKNFNEGDLDNARNKQALSIRVIELLNKYGGAIPAGKAFMKEFGLDCGPCRLPLKSLNEMNYKSFINEIEKLTLLTPEISGARLV